MSGVGLGISALSSAKCVQLKAQLDGVRRKVLSLLVGYAAFGGALNILDVLVERSASCLQWRSDPRRESLCHLFIADSNG